QGPIRHADCRQRKLADFLCTGGIIQGLNCIASAIYDDVGSVVAAISISGPSSRLTEDRFVSQGELVRDTARDISTALGLKAHP
uniref:IclR family transcriptional regulator domain-containing protein n=1 Tax=Escherichia coli TaxID=562 RepID=UPI0023786203